MLAFRILAICAIVAPVLLNPRESRASDGSLERGAYLMNTVVACGNCHSPKNPDGSPVPERELSGGPVFDEPEFHAVGPNITPDQETGIGKWTDQEIITAIREGKRPDGSIIGPPMPISLYRNISDTDSRALVAYLRAVKPVANRTGKSTYRFALPRSYGPPISGVPDTRPENKVQYGRYVSDIAHCMECHSPVERGRIDMSRIGAGGHVLPVFPSGTIVTPNLTAANPNGISRWTNAQIKDAITKGFRPDGRQLSPMMPSKVYSKLESRDLDALVTYLRTLRPAKPNIPKF